MIPRSNRYHPLIYLLISITIISRSVKKTTAPQYASSHLEKLKPQTKQSYLYDEDDYSQLDDFV